MKENKFSLLSDARIKTEVLKRLIRTASDLNIIDNKAYIILETMLQEISRMTSGWIKYVNK